MVAAWKESFSFIWMCLFHFTIAFSSTELSYLSNANKPLQNFYSQKDCPSKCSCNALQNITVNCQHKGLTTFPLILPPSVVYLNFVGNEIAHLFYSTSLKHLFSLNVSQNHIISLDDKWISSLQNLNILDLSYNFLHSSAIKNKIRCNTLETLIFSNNKLSVITDDMFNYLNKLMILDLSCNEIYKIDNSSFRSCNQLNILNLNSNRLTDLPHEWFLNLNNLHTLDLGNNKISILKNVVFSTLKNLKTLELSKNYIKSIGLLSFKGLNNLEFLNLSYNQISTLPLTVFRPLKSLISIDLSSNNFFKIDNTFIHTKSVKYLYLRNLSRFQNLTSFSLSGLNNLEVLDLSYSNLSHIDIKSFFDAKKLRQIYLSNAKLENLQMGVFSYVDKIEFIKLNGNPWRCDCYMHWLLTWLGEHTNTHLISPSETFCHSPLNLKHHVMLDALDLSMICTNATINRHTSKTKFKVGLPALLECEVEGTPLPSLTWLTPQSISLHWNPLQNNTVEDNETISISPGNSYSKNNSENARFYLMPNGNLAIKNVERGDGGFYTCVATNPLSYVSVSIRLTLDYEYLVHIKIISVLVGMATSFGFLLLTLVFVLIRMILKHFGIKCSCRNGSVSPRTQQIKKILESMEHYKKQQLDRLRDNYNGQVQKIKDNCMQQMERLRESYSSQSERLRDIREYGTLQIDRIRDNYYFQVQRVRDYSASQIIRLRENYLFQRTRIRKFSAHHLYKLRENYKLQQQHLNKILENLNIESCRNVCQRTESVIFEPDIFENVLVPKISLQTFTKEHCDSNDNSSQISAYFTPEDAGSEVSGHESDDQESINQVWNSEEIDATDVVFTEKIVETECISEKNDKDATFVEEKCIKNPSETIV